MVEVEEADEAPAADRGCRRGFCSGQRVQTGLMVQ